MPFVRDHTLDIFFFFNWDSPHARLNNHYEAWSYKKRSTKRKAFDISKKTPLTSSHHQMTYIFCE